MVCYHLTSEQLSNLSKRSKELSSVPNGSTTHGPSPASSTSSPPAGTGPSPAAQSTSSHHSTTPATTTHHHPPQTYQPTPTRHASSSPESHTSTAGLSDLIPLISSSTLASSRAQTYLVTSRHHLSLRILRTRFPTTFDRAIHSELADEALPAPGDMLGAAKRLGIDHVEVFAWPIELGMHCPVAHTAVFGRSMVAEHGEAVGEWQVRLE